MSTIMWTHFCQVDRCLISNPLGEPCSWCDIPPDYLSESANDDALLDNEPASLTTVGAV